MLSHRTKQAKSQAWHGRGKGGSDTHERSRNEKPVALFGHTKDRCRSRKLQKESAEAYLQNQFTKMGCHRQILTLMAVPVPFVLVRYALACHFCDLAFAFFRQQFLCCIA